MAAPSPFIQSGGMLGRYRVLEQIGMGGMGVVYRARDERLERDVAIKILAPGTVRSSLARHRVRNEALALSRISHPNIETIFEFDSLEQWDFLVVELIPGMGLDELLAHGPVSQSEAIMLCAQLLRGLAAAHEKGIIHRDLKPSNLRLSSDGFLKILDFGLAQFEDSDGTLPDFTTETHTTLFAGTLAYMSPEQVRGLALSPRSDLYSVGVVLYQMITGRLPFIASGATLIDAILNRPVPAPSRISKGIGGELQRVILKAMEKDPKRRYQSAREMLVDVEALASGAAQRAKRLKTKIQVGVTAALFTVAIVAGVVERNRISSWLERQLHPVPQNRYVAVLPFRSTGAQPDAAFNEGLTDAVASKLMEITGAQPVQIVSPGELKAQHISTADDAHSKLGVNLVLEGALQQLGGRTRVSLDLADSATGHLVRGANFNADSSDPFALEDQVIQSAVEMLEIEIHKNTRERGHGTTNAEAFRLYTRGRGFLQNQDNPEDIDSAIEQFTQALSIDPGYAAGHAALGIAFLEKYRITRQVESISRTQKECERSVSLDPDLEDGSVCYGELYLTTGEYEQSASALSVALQKDPADDRAYSDLGIAYERLGRMSQAEQTYKQAIVVRPQYAMGHDRLAEFYSHQARYTEAKVEFGQATRLAPLNSAYWASLGGIYYLSGDYQQALTTLQHAISLRPAFGAYTNLGHSYFALERLPEAIAAYEQALALGRNQIQAHGNLARAYYWFPAKRPLARDEYLKGLDLITQALKVNPHDEDAHLLAAQYCAMLGRRQSALQHLENALRTRPNDAETLYFAAIVHSRLGSKRETIFWLRKAIEHGYSRAEIEHTIEFDSLRNETEFAHLFTSST